MNKNVHSFFAHALGLAWGGFWSYFVVASELSEAVSLLQKAFVCLIGVTFFLGSASLPLVWKRGGGILLLAEGLVLGVLNFTYVHNPPSNQIFLLLTLVTPPFLAGLMLLLSQRQSK